MTASATKAWFRTIEEILYCEMTNTQVYLLDPEAASGTDIPSGLALAVSSGVLLV